MTINQQIYNIKVKMFRRNSNYFYNLVFMMHPTVDDFLKFLETASVRDLMTYGSFECPLSTTR